MESGSNKPAESVDPGQAEEFDSQGNEMTRKLKDADRAAVDMLFDRITATAAGNGNGNGEGLVSMSSAVSDANLQAVETVLDLLGQMPAPEPPADLATRTLQRIASASGSALPTMPGSYISPDQPLA
jgi:hypothetical protein